MKKNNLLERLLAKTNKRPQRFLLFLLFFVSLLSAQNAIAQERTLSGTVVDKENIPLPGVSVIVKGTSNGAQTDFDGNYQINVPQEGAVVLTFSYIGYKTQEVTVGASNTVNIVIEEDVDQLEEVVVVGYGTQKKQSVLGAVGTTDSETLKEQGNVRNLTDALTGAIPGLSILSASGMPGGNSDMGGTNMYAESQILIRGRTTWNDSSPLILVDGIERDMNDIDISEVATVSVLKDASATAVFGVKGANGVILITTKRGKEGKSKFTIEGEMYFETASQLASTVGLPEAARARNIALERTRRLNQGLWNEHYLSDTEIGYYRDNTYPYAYQNIRWEDELIKDYSTSYRLNATASGGTEKVKYFTSASFNHTGGILNAQDLGQGYVPDYSYDRFNIRTNFDFQVTKSTKVTANFSGMYGVQSSPPANQRQGLFGGLNSFSGDLPVIVYEDGIYGARDGSYDHQNSFFQLNFGGVESNPRTQINMDYTITQKLDVITKGLTIAGKLAYDNMFRTNGRETNDSGYITKTIDESFYLDGGYYDYETGTYMINGAPADMSDGGPYVVYDIPGTGDEGFGWEKSPNTYDPESVGNLSTTDRNLYYEVALRYARKFGVHNFTGLAMFSRQQRERGSNWPEKREDWVSRITYDYDSRYLFEVSGAYNGSQKFGPGYRFDFFPSFSVGWVVTNEAFMENVDWLSNLKVRYGNGLVGNDRVNTGSTWPYLTTYGTYGFSGRERAFYGYNSAYTEYNRYSEGNPGNPDLRWEKASKQNIGIELGAFKNKLVLEVDVFKEHRTDMLISAGQRENSVGPLTGKPAPPANLGEAKSHGGEILLTYRNRWNDLGYWVSTNWSVARSEVINLESAELLMPHQKPEGFPIGQSRTGITTGILRSWDDVYSNTGASDATRNGNILPGDVAVLDFNGDGLYQSADDSAPFQYPTYPQNNYGISFGGDYKGFDLSVRFVGAYNATRRVNPELFWRNNLFVPEFYLEHTATPEYDDGDGRFPELWLDDAKPDNPTGDFKEFDGSFIRLQSAQIGYSLPKKWLEPLRIDNFKVYVNGRNLFLWAKMPDDVAGLDDPGRNYPQTKQVNFGVRLGF